MQRLKKVAWLIVALALAGCVVSARPMRPHHGGVYVGQYHGHYDNGGHGHGHGRGHGHHDR